MAKTAPVLDYDIAPFSIDDVEEKIDAFSPAFLCPLCDMPNDSTCVVVYAHESFCLIHRGCLEEEFIDGLAVDVDEEVSDVG